MWKNIGNNLYSDGWRIRKRIRQNKNIKYQLISWIQQRCVDCNKFLKKSSGGNRCKKCFLKHRKKQHKISSLNYYYRKLSKNKRGRNNDKDKISGT